MGLHSLTKKIPVVRTTPPITTGLPMSICHVYLLRAGGKQQEHQILSNLPAGPFPPPCS